MAEQSLGAAEVMLYALCCGAALAIGAVHPTTQLVLSVLALALLISVAMSSSGRGVRVSPLAWVMIAATLYTAFQLLPLPLALLSILSKRTAELCAETGVRYAPISLDPASTALELAKQVAYVSVFMLGTELLRGRAGTQRVARVLAIFGVLMTVLIFTHRVFQIERIYGFYVLQEQPGGGFFAPFVNSNHAASVLVLCILAAFGVAAGTERTERLYWLAAGTVSTLSLLSTLSRGGAMALGVGGFFLVAMLATAQFGRLRGTLLALALLSSLSAGTIMLADGLRTRFVRHADGESLFMNQKTRQWLVALKLIQKYPIVGVGRGAFEGPAAALRVDEEGVRQDYAENVFLQVLGEWGIPFALGLCGWAVWRSLRSWRRLPTEPELAALCCGVLATFLHGLVDCGFEIPGVVILWVLALSAIDARAETYKKSRRTPRLRLRAGTVAAAGVIAGALLFVAMRGLNRLPDVEANRLRVSIDAKSPPSETELAKLIARHPSMAEIETLAGLVALSRRDGTALRHLGRAMRLQPSARGPHRLAALELVRRGALGQAALEFRLAAERGSNFENSELVRLLGKRAIDAVPRHPDAYAKMGIEFATLSRWDDMEDAFRRAMELDTGPVPRAALLSATRAAPEARKLAAAELVAGQAMNGLELSTAIAGLTALKKYERAEFLWTNGFSRYPDCGELLAAGVRNAAAKGDLEGARRLLLKTSALDARGRVLAGELALELATRAGDTDAVSLARVRLRVLRAKADLEEPALGGPK